MTTIHLGYEVGTGEPVAVPLAHTFVTGQTQLSGKTTTLRALVERSGRRSLAFVTKRGEEFAGRRIPPYLPREGEQPIHWRLVETILASALGQRSLKYERLWIVNAAKGAKSLADVRANVDRLKAKAKGGTADVYTLIGEYLDLVLPEMRQLAASDVLDLQPGLNVMELAGVGPQLQALVIRAALERINQHEKGILTVFPEAWEFAPRGRSAPAKDEAIAMARKGAVLGNYLLCDSQDIAGVDTVVRQAASVWILGVQRELNELKRTIASIPAGIAKPKAGDVATLELGQFYACWGRHAVKTYVQPSWLTEEQARRVAQGERVTVPHPPPVQRYVQELKQPIQESKPAAPPPQPQPEPEEDAMTPAQEAKLDKLLNLVAQNQAAAAKVSHPPPKPHENKPSEVVHSSGSEEELYQRFKARLLKELPLTGGAPLQVIPPEKLRKDFQQEEADRIIAAAREMKPLQKRILKLIETTTGYTSQTAIAERLGRSTGGGSWVDFTKAVKEVAALGFVEVKERTGVGPALRKKIAADLAFYQATEAEIDAVHQAVLHELATEGE